MTDRYFGVFPIHKSLSQPTVHTMLTQLEKVAEELDEVSSCVAPRAIGVKGVSLSAMLEETFDLIHAALGLAYVIEQLGDLNAEDYRAFVEHKNRARGYYGDGDTIVVEMPRN